MHICARTIINRINRNVTTILYFHFSDYMQSIKDFNSITVIISSILFQKHRCNLIIMNMPRSCPITVQIQFLLYNSIYMYAHTNSSAYNTVAYRCTWSHPLDFNLHHTYVYHFYLSNGCVVVMLTNSYRNDRSSNGLCCY